MLPRNTSLLECQHKSESHQASTYAVQIINYLDQRSKNKYTSKQIQSLYLNQFMMALKILLET